MDPPTRGRSALVLRPSVGVPADAEALAIPAPLDQVKHRFPFKVIDLWGFGRERPFRIAFSAKRGSFLPNRGASELCNGRQTARLQRSAGFCNDRRNSLAAAQKLSQMHSVSRPFSLPPAAWF